MKKLVTFRRFLSMVVMGVSIISTSTSCFTMMACLAAASMEDTSSLAGGYYGGHSGFNRFTPSYNPFPAFNPSAVADTPVYSSFPSTSYSSESSSSSSSSSSGSSYASSSSNTCPYCHGDGKCETCLGRGYFYSPFGTGEVLCPNCEKNHNGVCAHCHGTGKQ